jgi:hypothetical protein
MFIGQAPRSAPKPLCISAHRLRARARAAWSRGHSACSGKCSAAYSATYSAIASVSHTTRSPCTSRGTLPTGLSRVTPCLNCEPVSKLSKRCITSPNGRPKCFSSTQGRIDQDE